MAGKRSEVTLKKKLNYLLLALNEENKNSWKTDVIGVACQYSTNPKLKREDFKELVSMKIGELIKRQGLTFKL